MKTYWATTKLSHQGKIIAPGEPVKLEEDRARRMLARQLITDQKPKPPLESPKRTYRILKPVSSGGEIKRTGTIELPEDKGALLMEQGVLEQITGIQKKKMEG